MEQIWSLTEGTPHVGVGSPADSSGVHENDTSGDHAFQGGAKSALLRLGQPQDEH
jgi:hypothetical protein